MFIRLRDDEVYSGDEVRSMITALQDSVVSEVETELTDSAHTNVLLLQQLLSNAEQWHLTLTTNISELEDR
jgi:leucine zipper transcription factor-like protein 1